MELTGLALAIASMLDTAASEVQAGHAALLLSDGTPLYAPAEHERRSAELQARWQGAVSSAEQRIAEHRAAAQAQLTRLEGDPLATLDTATLQRAEAMRGLVAEDAERLPPAALAQRVAGVAQGQDRAAALVWLRYAEPRLRAGGITDAVAAKTIYDALPALRRLVDGEDRAAEADKARAALKAAEDAAIALNRRRGLVSAPQRALAHL